MRTSNSILLSQRTLGLDILELLRRGQDKGNKVESVSSSTLGVTDGQTLLYYTQRSHENNRHFYARQHFAIYVC